MQSTSTRYALLDELRGLDLISMMLYHGMWDLVYLFGVCVHRGMAAGRENCGSNPSAGCSSCCPASVCRWVATRSNEARWCLGAAHLSRRSR